MRSLPRIPVAALGLLLAFGSRGAAQDREEILSYDVAIRVEDGGLMDVTERLSVRALGDRIRRGIYRDFPTSFPRASGLGRIVAPFEVVDVERDGAPEPYSLQSIGGPVGRGGMRVRIGDADVLLDRGVHEYVIHYRTSRWVTFGDAQDELYWNVTGNGWDFPILFAAATVSLPRPVAPSRIGLESWTGPEGSTANAARAVWDSARAEARIETTGPLDVQEGLTFRLTFPRGIVAPPSPEVARQWFRMDWGGWIDAAIAIGLVLALYMFMWVKVGIDPARGTVVVRYEPPDGLSPAGMGYLKRQRWDNALLASALVDMAVKGTLTIEKDDKSWTLHNVDASTDTLTAEERSLKRRLLDGRISLELTPVHSSTIRSAVSSFRSALSRRFERDYFVLNRTWFIAGLVASIIGLGTLAWRDRYGIPPEAWFMCVWLSFWSIGVGTLLVRVWSSWWLALRGGAFGAWAGALVITLFSLPFVVAEVVVGGLLMTRVPHHLIGAAVGLGVINILFYHLLERPTLRGRGTLDQIEGFTRFLTATEADRLDRMTPPARTPELFQRYLPYAIALGVQNRWAEGFRDALAVGATAGSAAAAGALTQPTWFTGTATTDFSGIASALGGAFSSSLSAASSPPASSGGGSSFSSSSSGGSSGGGGGGGGGGGW